MPGRGFLESAYPILLERTHLLIAHILTHKRSEFSTRANDRHFHYAGPLEKKERTRQKNCPKYYGGIRNPRQLPVVLKLEPDTPFSIQEI